MDIRRFFLVTNFITHNWLSSWRLWCSANGVICWIFVISYQGKNPYGSKIKKKTCYKYCLAVHPILWPVVINKTIMQQNRIKTLQRNGNPLEQKKRRCSKNSNFPGRLHQSPAAQLAKKLKSIPVNNNYLNLCFLFILPWPCPFCHMSSPTSANSLQSVVDVRWSYACRCWRMFGWKSRVYWVADALRQPSWNIHLPVFWRIPDEPRTQGLRRLAIFVTCRHNMSSLLRRGRRRSDDDRLQ